MTWKDGAITRRAAIQQKIDNLQVRIDDLQDQILPRQRQRRSLVLAQQNLKERLKSLDEMIGEEA